MNSPDQNPKLPMWIFLLTDAVLLSAALFIAMTSARPLSTEVTFAIFACIFAGAFVALVPMIARFERQKNDALDERQRELEALARTVSACAEQISIAVSSLHEIAESTQKNVRHAEQLPHKLQEKVAEFQAQLANVTDTEKEELEKELETLRGSESEKLESIASKIAKSVADWTKLEAATAQHLAAASDAISKLSFGTASAIGKAQVAAEQALGQARVEAARAFGDASGSAVKAIDAAKTAALAEIEAQLTRSGTPAEKAGADAPSLSAKSEETSPPSRPRKPARSNGPAANTAEGKPAPADDRVTAIAAPEPQPVLVEEFAEIAPVAPDTPDPFTRSAATPGAAQAPAHTNGEQTTSAPKPIRKRGAKKTAPEVIALGSDDPSSTDDTDSSEGVRSGVIERVMTSDGATRLLVTAYIGIGNRLFIRGEGPGLTWEKGVPLQFVSIGKWRWETNDAARPVKFKLFKNDDLECATLGAQSLDPGHQQEVTAAF